MLTAVWLFNEKWYKTTIFAIKKSVFYNYFNNIYVDGNDTIIILGPVKVTAASFRTTMDALISTK